MDKPYSVSSDGNLYALIITYNPSNDFDQHIKKLLKIFDHIILVDNCSSPDIQEMLNTQAQIQSESITVVLNSKNLGVATALNQGLKRAIQRGYQYIITLDQDSIPTPTMAKALFDGFQSHPNQKKLAVLAPLVIEEIVNRPPKYIRLKKLFFFERAACDGGVLRNVTSVITSGSFYNIDVFKKIGTFRDDFFIDYVDTEYCLRAIQNGYEISVLCDARLIHNLGKRQKKNSMGRTFYPTFHDPSRWYYISRNRITMLRLYALRFPHWFFYELKVTLTGLLTIILFEDLRIEKLKAVFIGTLDGVLRRNGEITPIAKRILRLK